MSLRYGQRDAQLGPPELFHRRRVPEQKALHAIETHFTDSKKISATVYAFGDRARAIVISELENSMAHHLFQSIVCAARDEFLIDLDFDEGKFLNSHEGRPLVSNAVDREGDLVKSKLPGNILH